MSLLIESSVRAVIVAAAVAVVVHGLRIASARARHLAWCGVLATMLFLPAFCAWGPESDTSGAASPRRRAWHRVDSNQHAAS